MVGRKGYTHALEGVIAALIVVFYLSSIISVPSTTKWTQTTISKESEDLLSAMDHSGFLDRTIARGDTDSFNAMMDVLDRSLSYSITVEGIPKSYIRVGVLVRNSSTYRFSTQTGDWSGTGLPDTFDGSGYRRGNLSTVSGFGDVPFVISDTNRNGLRDYTAVNFDLDSDGSFGETVNGVEEGPYSFSDRFSCRAGVSGCSGETYEVGSFNTTLVLYDGSYASFLEEMKEEMSIGLRTVQFDYGTANPSVEGIEKYDAVIAKDWNASELREYSTKIQDFLEGQNLLIVQEDVDDKDIDSNYLGALGFDFLQGYSLEGSGKTRNVFFSLHDPHLKSYTPANYYIESSIKADDFTTVGDHLETTLRIRGNDIGVKVYDSKVSFETDSYSTNYSIGESVVLEKNRYTVESIRPLKLNPSSDQYFKSFNTGRVDADYHLTKMENRTYNITEYDSTATYSEAYSDREDLPRDYSDGPVNTVCGNSPYHLGNITVEGVKHTFLLVNFELEAPCDNYFEYVYFDFPRDNGGGDGDFDDRDAANGYSDDGPYQYQTNATINGNPYRVIPHRDGDGLDLERIGQRKVGEIPVSTGITPTGGTAALIQRENLGEDDVHLLSSLIAFETQESVKFTQQRTLGETSLGYTYTSTLGRGTPTPYTLNTVWWFQ
ncbi:MAG: hypothetical protein SVQ76_02185 [Candidatus Nanohaloarchaea archaeon]|nr:hypothetical protein [Candidatus Nanohaloarchaea archaeon]